MWFARITFEYAKKYSEVNKNFHVIVIFHQNQIKNLKLDQIYLVYAPILLYILDNINIMLYLNISHFFSLFIFLKYFKNIPNLLISLIFIDDLS